jgi:hypothetical protein
MRLCLSLLLLSRILIHMPVKAQQSETLIFPAYEFLDEIPKGNIITDAASQKVDWLFSNTGIVLNSATNLMKKITVNEAGTYKLFVRSMGTDKSSFKVAINDKVTELSFGTGLQSFTEGGSFELKKGLNYIKITRINPGAIFDVIALSKTGITEKAIALTQIRPDVVQVKEYNIPNSNAVKFGDVNGDGQTDFMVLEPDFSAQVFDNSGKALWQYRAPTEYVKERSEFEAPGVLWDFNHDGNAEVLHWRFIDNLEYLVMADGKTGQIIRKVPWPTQPLPHVYNNFRMAIAKLTSGAPNQLVVYTDMGGRENITAYDENLNQLWQQTEHRKKDNLGHYIYPIDLNNDGIDEVLVGSLLLDAKGKEIWNRFDLLPDNHDHADSYKFADINGDGKTDLVTANSETGVFIYEAMTGKIIWQAVAEHSQQIQAGKFLGDKKQMQVVVGGRTYGKRQINEPYLSSQLYWFDQEGNQLMKWPGNPINGNPDFVKGAWNGRDEQLFWYKFFIKPDGKGQLYFPDPVFHMFDFTGRGAEEVITLTRGKLRVFASKAASHSGADRKKDLQYLRHTVVNHTHY